MGRVLLVFIFGVLTVPIAVVCWLKFGQVPVAVTDPPLPLESLMTSIPLHARIEKELITTPITPNNGANLVAGAEIYRDQCATCHGIHGRPSSFGAHMYPPAPPLWEKHEDNDAVGVSDDPAYETYWKVSNGIRLTGMPSFKRVLTNTQIWQVSQLVAAANKPLPQAAVDILRGRASSALEPTAILAPAKR